MTLDFVGHRLTSLFYRISNESQTVCNQSDLFFRSHSSLSPLSFVAMRELKTKSSTDQNEFTHNIIVFMKMPFDTKLNCVQFWCDKLSAEKQCGSDKNTQSKRWEKCREFQHQKDNVFMSQTSARKSLIFFRWFVVAANEKRNEMLKKRQTCILHA